MKKKALFLLTLTIAFGAFLRLYKFESTLRLDADQAMAFLLADRILNYGHRLLVGPGTSLTDVNILPPTYYYLITGLYYLLRSELSVSLVFAVAGIASIYLIFWLGKLLFDVKTGLIAAYLYALSATMIAYSRNIWEPHLVPFFIITSLLFLILAHRKKGKLLLPFVSIVFLAGSFMYISSLLILPTFIVLTIYILRLVYRNLTRAILTTATMYLIVFGLLYLPILSYETSRGFPSVNIILDMVREVNPQLPTFVATYINSVSTHFTYLVRSILLSDLNYTLILFFSPFLIPLFPLLKTSIVRNRGLNMFVLILASGLFITGLYQKKVETHRMASLYPILFVVMAYVVKWSVSARKAFSVTFLASSLVLFYTIIYSLQNYYSATALLYHRGPSRFDIPFITARYILESAGKDTFTIYTITPIEKNNYYSVAYIYAVEKITGTPYTTLNKQGNWITPDLNDNVRWVYLICQNFTMTSVKIICQEEFERTRNVANPVEDKYIGGNWIFKYPY